MNKFHKLMCWYVGHVYKIMLSALLPSILLFPFRLNLETSWLYLHCSLTDPINPSELLKMYLSILALLHLLISYALANGCHTDLDTIGCPTMMAIGTIDQAIADFCALNFETTDSSPAPTKTINVGTSWPGVTYYSPAIYKDPWGNLVSFWANFRVDRTSNKAPYTLDYNLCISLLDQAATGNGTELHSGMKDCTNTTGNGLTYGGWGNTDFGTVFAEPICPSGISCLPEGYKVKGC